MKRFEKYLNAGRAGHLRALLEINDVEEARAYVVAYAQRVLDEGMKPDWFSSLVAARDMLGYVTGDGVPLEKRRWWYLEANVRHPYVPEYAERDVSPSEFFRIGMKMGEELRAKGGSTPR